MAAVMEVESEAGYSEASHPASSPGTWLFMELGQANMPYRGVVFPSCYEPGMVMHQWTSPKGFAEQLYLHDLCLCLLAQKKVVNAVDMTIERINAGVQTTSERMRALGVEPSDAHVACMKAADAKRVAKAEKAAEEQSRKVRKARQLAKKKALSRLEEAEDPQVWTHTEMHRLQEHLEDLERVGLEDFTEKVWPHIKEIYKSPAFKEEVRNAEREAHLPAGEAEEKAEGEEPPATPGEEKKEKEEEEKMPDYDEETKKLIEAADAARQAFREVEDKVRNVENEINDLNKYLQLDLGPEEEYGVLKGKCFEYTDREYTYKFCPFEKTSQRPKSGGMETSLGTWGKWDGTSEDPYAAQKYERGQNCWNGPDRSAKVLFHCGIVDELTSASEPNRCEYQFDFSTPAKCAKPSPDDFKTDTHDEL